MIYVKSALSGLLAVALGGLITFAVYVWNPLTISLTATTSCSSPYFYADNFYAGFLVDVQPGIKTFFEVAHYRNRHPLTRGITFSRSGPESRSICFDVVPPVLFEFQSGAGRIDPGFIALSWSRWYSKAGNNPVASWGSLWFAAAVYSFSRSCSANSRAHSGQSI